MVDKLNDDLFYGNDDKISMNSRLLIESNDDNMTIIVDKINELIEYVNKIECRDEIIFGGGIND